MKIKVYTTEIEKGMFVCELDRPWLGTPFLFQGFLIRTHTEIRQLQAHCHYVYVDSESSRLDRRTLLKIHSVDGQMTRASAKPPQRPKPAAHYRDVSLEATYQQFRRHLLRAREIRSKARRYIDRSLEDVRLGHGVDTQSARELVSELARQVVESPDALVWLTHLKRRDEYTATHCINVCVLSLTFGRFLGLKKDSLFLLGMGALLHDLGKMRVPEEILHKPSRLTEEEFQQMRAHPELGHVLLKQTADMPSEVLDIVLHHHERLDGRGYPDGLIDSSINRLTKMVSIVDVYDAITSDRAYHDAMSPASALKNMYNWAPNNFDLQLIEGFIRCIGIYPVGSIIQLNTGEAGVIVASNEGHRLRPLVLLVLDEELRPYSQRRLINLASPVWDREDGSPRIDRVLEPGSFAIDIRPIIEAEVQLAEQMTEKAAVDADTPSESLEDPEA
jgi:HD-GYP domain-containing protein (c-di-GMP phosphodiesterase class II)